MASKTAQRRKAIPDSAEGEPAWQSSHNALGNIVSRVEHGHTLTESVQKIAAAGDGTSIFDPVLCELAYRWFTCKGAEVLDPFAGGSVRGIVAGVLGRAYTGIELSERQIEANRQQAARIKAETPPTWMQGDSRNLATLTECQFDFVFSCPPYWNLEVYSEDAADLSTLDYQGFLKAYSEIIAAACSKLRENRFACFVVGEVRDKSGRYVGFVPDTIKAFEAAGLRFYNDAVLVTVCGSLPIRAGKQFDSGRKLGKTHQNVLIFVKGDVTKAVKWCGACEFGEPSGELPDTEFVLDE